MTDARKPSEKENKMKKIEKLTKEQAERLPLIRDEWLRHGLSTEPADRQKAEEGVRLAYKSANLEPPKYMVWLNSPMEGAIGAAFLKIGNGAQVGAQVRDQVRDQVWDQVGAQVWAQVRDQVGAQEWAQVRDQVGAQVWAAGYGQHDASWLSFYKAFDFLPVTERLHGLWMISQSAGWWWPFENICLLTERPVSVLRDANNRPHSIDQKAIEYRDGWGIYAVHGTRIPAEWIEAKASLTPQKALTWKNIEQRRAACEILGWEKILSALDAKVIDTDPQPQVGQLVEVNIPEIGKERFLRVLCGTGRSFALPVPPNMKTALEANSWTYRVDQSVLRNLEIRT